MVDLDGIIRTIPNAARASAVPSRLGIQGADQNGEVNQEPNPPTRGCSEVVDGAVYGAFGAPSIASYCCGAMGQEPKNNLRYDWDLR